MPRRCLNSSDIFCYICGQFATKDQRLEITEFVKQCYNAYFRVKLGDQNKIWAPHIVCKPCVERLRKWSHGLVDRMPFGIPMIWRETTNHTTDCYFCMTNVIGFNRKTKHKIEYPNLPSAIRPVMHSDDIPVPKPPNELPLFLSDTESSAEDNKDNDFTIYGSGEPQLFSQDDLDDLTRDLNLSKKSAQLLGSRLKEKNLLASGTTFSWYKQREREFVNFFATDGTLVYCNDIAGLIIQMGLEYEASQWRFFIDSSKRSLKGVLLHNGNEFSSVPIAHSVIMKETYMNIKILLEKVNYNHHRWLICGDLKVVALLQGLQGGYSKFPCFLCLWDSRADDKHYNTRDWPLREEFVPGNFSVKEIPLVEQKRILLPPLHIKLGLMKKFVKALDKDGDAFKYLAVKFPRISEAKRNEGIFVGPQIRELMKDDKFVTQMKPIEVTAWINFKSVVDNFLGNKRSDDAEKMIREMIISYKEIGSRMSVKMHFLNSHFNYFPANCGNYSEEQGERFHQEICEMERRYQGNWSVTMLADYCWGLKRHKPTVSHKRKSVRRHFLSEQTKKSKI